MIQKMRGTFECIRCGRIETAERTIEDLRATVGEQLSKPKVLCVIPARLESTRLPGKVLLKETGKPLIQHVWENAKSATLVDRVVFAIPGDDDRALAMAVSEFDGAYLWTGQHNSGTDRVAEVAELSVDGISGDHFDIIINLQADEPEITSEDLDQLVRSLVHNLDPDMATMAWETECPPPIVLDGKDTVKVVFSEDSRAVYFSRSRIPQTSPWWIHAGVYAFRRNFLLEFAGKQASRLENAERLEQLRAIEMGAHIHVEKLSHPTHGIDTPEDYQRFVVSQKIENITRPVESGWGSW